MKCDHVGECGRPFVQTFGNYAPLKESGDVCSAWCSRNGIFVNIAFDLLIDAKWVDANRFDIEASLARSCPARLLRILQPDPTSTSSYLGFG
jgi:hypothetical protein